MRREPASTETGRRSGGCDCGPSTRRDLLATMSILALQMAAVGAAIPAAAEPASERPKEGDFLVAVESTSAKSPLEPKDIRPDAAPMFAWPMDPAGDVVRDGSRLNKVLVLRLDPATLVGETRNRAADGILAYSAVCPHSGCDVAAWLADAKLLECPCHASHFNPRQAGALIDGPAPRDLPALPLKIADGKLIVAKPFTSRPGFVQN
jgi:rieske iron-sulfur protein